MKLSMLLLGGSLVVAGVSGAGCSQAASVDRAPSSATVSAASPGSGAIGSTTLGPRTLVGEYIGRYDPKTNVLRIDPVESEADLGGLSTKTVTTWGQSPHNLLTFTTLGSTYVDNGGANSTYANTSISPAGTAPACSVQAGFNSALCGTVALTAATTADYTNVDIEVTAIGPSDVVVVNDDSSHLSTAEKEAGVDNDSGSGSGGLGVWRWSGTSAVKPDGVTRTTGPTTWQFDGTSTNETIMFSIRAWGQYFQSCNLLLGAYSGEFSGTHTINPGGLGPISVFCDMVFDDGNGNSPTGTAGGWTLFEVTTSTVTASTFPSTDTVVEGTAGYLTAAKMEALAGISQQLHIRSPVAVGSTPSLYVTTNNSVSTVLVSNLKAGKNANQQSDVSGGTGSTEDSLFIAGNQNDVDPSGTLNRLDFGCSTSSATYPSIYWACGNGAGFHLTVNTSVGGVLTLWSTWSWNGGNTANNIPLEAYLR